MAGIARPTVAHLGKEVLPTNLTSNSIEGSVNGLFDGTCVNDWNGTRVCYWNKTSSYIEFTIDRKVNIWRCGTTGWATQHCSLFRIEKLQDDGTYLDITNEITQSVSPITEKEWEKTVSNLDKGTYRFYTQKTRLDSEWYMEDATGFIIFMNQKYYTIENNTLVEINEEITTDVIDERGVLESTINENISLLFGNVKFISNDSNVLELNCLKTNNALVIENNDLPTTIQANINYFESQTEISGNGEIKMVFSIDEGITWKTHNGVDFVDLPVIIPCKPYNELTEDELIQWNNARDEILANGIHSDNLKTLDFNTITFDKIRFAYVLHVDNTEDVALNKTRTWQFDAKDSMILMKDDEIDIEVLPTGIKVTPKVDSSLIKLNIVTDK